MAYVPGSPLVDAVWNRLPVGGEFQGYYGDCTEYAFMIGRAAINPAHPTDKAELDRLTSQAIAAGDTTSNQGAMTAANLASLCQLNGEHYHQSAGNTWQQVLQQVGNHNPVILQVANGAALPGNQPGVQGHAVVVLAVSSDLQHVTLANGDSTNGKNGALDDQVPVSALAAASPFAVTWLGDPAPKPPTIADYEKRLGDVAALASAPVYGA